MHPDTTFWSPGSRWEAGAPYRWYTVRGGWGRWCPKLFIRVSFEHRLELMGLRDLEIATRSRLTAVWKVPIVASIVFASRPETLKSLEKFRGRCSIQQVHSKRSLGYVVPENLCWSQLQSQIRVMGVPDVTTRGQLKENGWY